MQNTWFRGVKNTRKSVKRLSQIKKLMTCRILNAPSLRKFSPNLSTKLKRKASGHSFTNKLRRRKSCQTRQQNRLNGKSHSKNANSRQRSTRSTRKGLKLQKWRSLFVNPREISQSISSTSCNLPLGNPNLQSPLANWARKSKQSKRANQSVEFKSLGVKWSRLKRVHHWKLRLLLGMNHRFLVSSQAQKF